MILDKHCLDQTSCSVHEEQERAACRGIPADNTRFLLPSQGRGKGLERERGVQISLEGSLNPCRYGQSGESLRESDTRSPRPVSASPGSATFLLLQS